MGGAPLLGSQGAAMTKADPTGREGGAGRETSLDRRL